MVIRKSELPVVIDVDETLIKDPKSDNDLTLSFDYYGVFTTKVPIQRHIDLLKSYKARGYEVTVWSANGYQWAEEVVRVLRLETYVDHVATKPTKYVDDKDANTWMQKVFIHE